MWILPTTTPYIYKRNPLALVVVQWSFHEILRLKSDVAPFQEFVREKFPRYEPSEAAQIQFNPLKGAIFSHGTTHSFRSLDNSSTLSLSSSSLTLEVTKHSHAEELFSLFDHAVLGLDELASPLGIRLGVRYVNHIRLDTVAQDIGRTVAWEDLVAKELLSPYADLAVGDDTRFYREVTAALNPGEMTVRSGLLKLDPTQPRIFLLDTDRFYQDGVSKSEIPSLIERFTKDAFSVFEASTCDTLRHWMKTDTGAAVSDGGS